MRSGEMCSACSVTAHPCAAPRKLLSADWEGADIAAHHPGLSCAMHLAYMCVCVYEERNLIFGLLQPVKNKYKMLIQGSSD